MTISTCPCVYPTTLLTLRSRPSISLRRVLSVSLVLSPPPPFFPFWLSFSLPLVCLHVSAPDVYLSVWLNPPPLPFSLCLSVSVSLSLCFCLRVFLSPFTLSLSPSLYLSPLLSQSHKMIYPITSLHSPHRSANIRLPSSLFFSSLRDSQSHTQSHTLSIYQFSI